MISLGSGGHYYDPSTGGDSFTSMQWRAMPGAPTELDNYLAHLWMAPDVRPFAEAVSEIEFVSGAYRIKITDPKNKLLQDEDESDNESES